MSDKIDFATVSYVLGILSIVFAIASSPPLAGLILGLIGLTQSKKHGVSKAKKLNIIGIVLSIIFFVIWIVALVYAVNSGLGLGTGFPSV